MKRGGGREDNRIIAYTRRGGGEAMRANPDRYNREGRDRLAMNLGTQAPRR